MIYRGLCFNDVTIMTMPRYGFRSLLLGRGGPCVDIAQPDIAGTGGLSEFIKIAALGNTK